MRSLILSLLLVNLLFLHQARGEFFDFGERYGDKVEQYSPDQLALALTLPIVYLEKSHDELYLSFDGIVAFQKLPTEYSGLQELNVSSIAVYYAPAIGTNMYYRVTSSDRNALHRITQHIREAFEDAQEFHTLEAVIITWDKAKNHEANSGEATFQLVIASDGRESYAIMQYRQLPWTASKGYFAQSGFTHSDGRHTLNTNSGTSVINELTHLSNTNSDKYGGFVFRISGSEIEDPKDDPESYDYRSYDENYDNDLDKEPDDCPKDPYKDNCPQECTILYDQRGCSRCVCAEIPQHENGNNVELEDSSQLPNTQYVHREPPTMKQTKSDLTFPENSCESDALNDCSEYADCENYKTGHCCVCQDNYYGNGIECLLKGDPIRISGNFEGVINGKPIDKTDLHTFVTPNDGRSFTAVPKIPSDLGHSFLLLHPIGSVMGWLFAIPSQGAYNGFELTGGLFNRTVSMHIGDRYRVSIRQQFNGRDIYHYLKSNVYVHGTLPDIAPGAVVTIPDFIEDYKRESIGLVRSQATMDVTVKEGSEVQTYKMIITQEINYKECSHKTFERDPNLSLSVERVNVIYNENEGIVRYGFLNKIRRSSDVVPRLQQQPVQTPRQHGQTQQEAQEPYSLTHAQNQVQLDSSDACAEGKHRCTLPNMKCRAVEPSYRCECSPGFQAQHDQSSPIGWRCIDLDECQRGDHRCDKHASCMNTEGSYTCRCMDGYTGDGYRCQSTNPTSSDSNEYPSQGQSAAIGAYGSNECTTHAQCHQWGECVFTPGKPNGYCKCRGWYVGDGVRHCGPPEDKKPQHNANIPQHHGKPCGNHICAVDAECLPDTRGGSECVCKAGYVGNGIHCEALLDEEINQASDAVGTVCRSHEECSTHGSCAYSHSLGYYQCQCTPPYIGNGIDCNMPGQQPSIGDEIILPSNRPQGCDVTKDCSEFADCVFEMTRDGGIYKCVCQAGYTGDGKYCMQSQLGIQGLPPLQPLGCDVMKNCDTNAACVYDSHTNTHKCECNENYVGDGKTCVLTHSGQPNWEGTRTGPKQCREQTDCHQNGHCVALENGRGNICECLPGFRGDGVTQCANADECTPVNRASCYQNAECVFGEAEQSYVCKCIKGFTYDGTNCRPHAPPTTCQENPRLCHANAQCIYRHETQQHECRCKPGSQGDGYQRCDVMDTPQCSNCSIHAHCAQNPTTGGFACVCNAGYQGNGRVCGAMTSCLEDKSICDEHAQCVPGESGYYICNCDYGYRGDGRKCTADSEDRGDKLLIARGMAIFERGTSPDIPGKQLIVIPNHIPVGLDFDCEEERIFWSDITGHSIRSAALNGTDLQEFLRKELSSPEGIAIDWKSRNIYYADSAKDEIGVASLDGRYQKALLTEGLVNPRSIAIDFASRHLYYADWHRENPFIGRIDLDGQNNRVFLNDQIHLPNGITILPNRRELCWVDAGSQRLSCIGLNGSNRRVVYANIQYPFGLTQSNEERFYWTDWKDNRIHTVGVYGEGYNSFPISLGGSGKVYGILSVPKTCNTPSSPCSENNGGCKGLCLPSSTNGVTCACPDNTSLKGC